MIWAAKPWLPLRGTRNYIRGVDFYSATVDLVAESGLGEIQLLSLRFPRFSTKAGQLVLADAASFDKGRWKESPVRIGARSPEHPDLRGWYEELPVEAPRISGEENAQIEQWEAENRQSMAVDGDSFRVRGNSHIPAIETVVSANKFYLQSRFAGYPGQWAFSGLEIDRAFRKSDSDDIQVVFLSDHEAKTTASDIVVCGQKIGKLFFSRIV